MQTRGADISPGKQLRDSRDFEAMLFFASNDALLNAWISSKKATSVNYF
jgi:hypothetical protein